MVTFSIPGAAGAAIQIDEPSLFPGVTFEAEGRRAGFGFQFVIKTDTAGALVIRRECVDRLSMQGGEGFDDPKSWLPALRKAIKNIDAALAKWR
jgi:hypothetical protein